MRYLVGWLIAAVGMLWIWVVFSTPPLGVDPETETAANMVLAIPALILIGFGLLVARK